MSLKEKETEKEPKKTNDLTNKEDNTVKIYCITRFNSKINNSFDLIAKNSEVLSIKILLKTSLKYYKDYDFIVYEITISKKLKQLNLGLNSNFYKKFYELNSIKINSSEQKIILIKDDLLVVQNSMTDLINDLDIKLNNDILRKINISEKFNIYLQSFEEQENKNELKTLLASQTLSTLKKNSEIKFSVLISLFNIVFETKLINKFLDIYPQLDIDYDDISQQIEEFKNKKLKLCQENEEQSLKNNINLDLRKSKSKKTMKNEDEQSKENYKNLLDNFIVLYELMYGDRDNIEQKKLINVREIFINLMENKNDLFKIIRFVLIKFDIIYLLITKGNKKRITMKPFLNQFSSKIEFENFSGLYQLLLTKQSEKSEKYIFDFSEVFNYFVDKLNNLDLLISLKILYKKELSTFSNKYFQENIIKKIHKIGVKEINAGTKKNTEILTFLINDDVYCDKNCKIGEYKDYEILKQLNIELMDNNFFQIFQKHKIYSFFEENYVNYLKMFPSINKMKYFGLFFKLLPPDKYRKQTTLHVFNWLNKKINTYNREDCPNFENEIEIFYKILNNSEKYLLPKLIEKLVEFFGKDCIELFIYLINKISQNLGQNESELMINYIIFENINEDENENKKIKLNNLDLFLEKVKPCKLIAKTFLNIIGESAITESDFLSEKNKKFELLDKLLELKDYSLLEEPENKNCQYWINTINESKIINENIKNMNFELLRIQILFNILKEKTLIQRVALIARCLGEADYDSYASTKVNNLKQNLNIWQDNLKKIEKIANTYQFINKPPKIISLLYDYNVKIYKSTFQYLNSQEGLREFSDKCINFEIIEKIDKLRECDIFLNIFNNTKNKYFSQNSDKLIDIVLERFDKIKNLFVNNKATIENELKNNEEAKFLIDIAYKNENNLEKEIDWMLNYFKINDFELKTVLIYSIKLIIKKDLLYSMTSGFLKLFDIYKDFLHLANKEDISLYQKIMIYQNYLLPNKYIPLHLIEEINNNIENIFELNEFNSKIFFKLLNEINKYPDSMKFIKDKKFEEVENLFQFLLESDDSNLTEKDINDFINVVKYLQDIISNINEEIVIFIKFLKKILSKLVEDEKFQKSFFNYIEKYSLIQTLFNNYLKHSEGSIIIIEKILKDSYFYILKSNLFLSSGSYEIQGSYFDQKTNNIINNNELNNENNIQNSNNQYRHMYHQEIELLFQRVYISNIPKKYEEEVDLFIKFFKSSKKLKDLLEKFYKIGNPKNFDDITILIQNKKIICKYMNEKYDNIESLMTNFEKIYNEIDKQLNNCYYSYDIMRFFYGRQIIFIYNSILNKRHNRILELLNATFGNCFKKYSLEKLDFGIIEKQDKLEYIRILYFIYNYINEQFKYNKINPAYIFEKNRIIIDKFEEKKTLFRVKSIKNSKEPLNEKYKGIYFYVSRKNSEMEALNLYITMTQNFPLNGSFLYCSKDVSFEELYCFIIRFFYCKENILFSIVNADLLESKIKEEFISIIQNIVIKYNNKIKACLVIIFRKGDTELHNYLMKIKNVNPFPQPNFFEKEFEFKDYFKHDDYVVQSACCGIGKSEFIKSKNSDMTTGKSKPKIHYIYFPIGGKFSKKDLFDRLFKLPDMTNLNEKFAIHIDISQTKEIQILKEFFFKLIIFRKCDMKETARNFGSNVKIIIELPNDFIDYKKNIEILSKLKKENIEQVSTLKLTPELINVAKILSLYESDAILKSKKVDLDEVSLDLDQSKITSLINKYLGNINVDKPNYYQFNIFIKILADEFIKFYDCQGYSVDTLANNGIASKIGRENTLKLIGLRKFIIKSLIQVTKIFLVGPYESFIKSQEKNKKIMNENGEEKEKLINKELNIKIDSVSFDSIKPSLIVFNEDGGSCTIIATCSEKESEFQNLERLYNTQNPEYLSCIINKNKKIEQIDYKKLKPFKDLSGDEIFDNLISFLNASKIKEKKKEILGSYIYTPDNFIKVVLILMRIRVGIPVILMGETGCGKTSLIEMASKLINNGKICIYKMNIHAGIEDDDIINFMNDVKKKVNSDDDRKIKEEIKNFESLPEKTQKAYLKNKTREKIYESYAIEVMKKKIWIFFDEINTCNSMGLFTEIMCKNTMRGEPLDSRYVYIAACNPYRVSDENSKSNILNVLYKKNQKKKNLVYTVNPLPISLLNFVFNFGSLKEKDESIYIQSMLEISTDELFSQIKDQNVLNQKDNFIKKETECVHICQNYMKKNNDVSIVSLREVKRYNIFFKFFFNYLIKRKNETNNYENHDLFQFYNSKNELDILFFSANLSLFICYYLRIADKQSRAELCAELNKTKYFNNGNFLLIPQLEQNYLLDNFQIPVGIAKNKNLKENIFLLFFCIITKIPVIICGAPGKSKSLSFEILQDSMKGRFSKSNFCRQFPPLTAFKIQGSLHTTSDEITKIFKKGRTYQIENNDKLSVVFMDEMGLAEISENNPLKVMHAELENEENPISFVGISNWFIDASKMNRVVYNVVQDDEEEDVILTGKEIAKSYEKNMENFNSQHYEDLITKLSKAYYQFISMKKEINDTNQFFHGSRDFYCLIKSVILDIIKNNNDKYKSLNDICMNQILRNFSGLKNSVDEFNSYYLEDYEKMVYSEDKKYSYNFKKCIQDNINDKDSRYLLLINDGHLSQELFNYIIEEINNNRKNIKFGNEIKDKEKQIQFCNADGKEEKEVFVKYYAGSKFKADKNSVFYSNEILNKIRVQMETENILILKDLEIVYPSLYELFNQNYIYLNGKKFVHLGESKSLALVNDNFKVIVLIEKDKLENQEAPFLNRFEKHIIDFSHLLNEELKELSSEIFDNLKEIFDFKNYIPDKYTEIKNRFEEYTLNVKVQEIESLVYIASKQINYSRELNVENERENRLKIRNFVLERIVPCFSEELMVLITKFLFRIKYNSFHEDIIKCYKNKYCYNFDDFLEKSKDNISIIYTFSSLYEDINNSHYSNDQINIINVSNIKSIEHFNNEIMDSIFDENNNEKTNKKSLLIIKFSRKDLAKLNNIYYSIIDYISNSRKRNIDIKTKKIVFIVHIKNMKTIIDGMSFLSNCPQIMINKLNNEIGNFPELLNKSNKDMITKKLFNIDSMIEKDIENSLRYFNFKLYNFRETENISYKKIICGKISNSLFLKNIIIESLSNFVNDEEELLIKIYQKNINTEKNNELNEISNFSYYVEKYLQNLIKENLRTVFLILEREQIINSIISNEKLCQIDLIKTHIDELVSNINNKENSKFNWTNMNLNQKIELNIIDDIKFPFCHKIVKNLFCFIQNNISSDFLEKENYFISKVIPTQNLENENAEYWKIIKKLEDKLKSEIYKDIKNDIIFDILNSNNENIISQFFENCFYTFMTKNEKLKSQYKSLSQILNLLIQLRLKTRINNELNIYENKIELEKSFLDLVKKEWSMENNEEYIENLDINDKKINNNSIYFNIFISVMIFLQSYSKEIYIILELFDFLLENNPSLFDKIKSMINNNEIKMENSNRNSHYNKIFKSYFFYIIESLCKILKQELKEIISVCNDTNKKIRYFKSFLHLVQNIFQLNKRFLLFSKEIFYLDIAVKIIIQILMKASDHSFLYLNINYLMIFFEEVDEKNLTNNLTQQDAMLTKIFADDMDKYGQLMSKIIFNYYRCFIDNKTRENIIKKIILEKNQKYHEKLLEYIYPLLKYIFTFNKMELPVKKDLKSLFLEAKSIPKLINDENNQIINDILFFRFEILVENYFQNIIKINKGKKDLFKKLCGELSKKYLEEAIECIYGRINTNNINLNNIYKLYCFAYIKVYLRHYVEILFDEIYFQQFVENEKVNEFLFSNKIPQKKVINYYLVKLISKKYSVWEKFVDYYNSITKEDNDIFGFNKYGMILKFDNECFIQPPFLLHCFKIRENKEYNKLIEKGEFDKELFDSLFLKQKKFNYLYIFLANASILLHSYKNEKKYDKMRNNLIGLSRVIINYLESEKKQINKDILYFFNEFFIQNNLSIKIFPKIGLSIEDNDEKKLKKIKILYYSLLFVISILNYSRNESKKKDGELLYENLISHKVFSILNSEYLPGNFQFSNLKVRSFYRIKEILKSEPTKCGVYLCSCGNFYQLYGCTFPTQEYICSLCSHTIGGKNYNLVERKGHMRVFLDNETKNAIMTARYSDMPFILLEDLEKEINLKKQTMNKGIKLKDMTIDDFLLKDEKVRKMNDITYRFMNFVLYSFIFYDNIYRWINEIDITYYTFNNNTCFDMIEKNWEIMQEILDKIPVELFINLIFDDVIEKLASCERFQAEGKAIKFEEEINEIIMKKINDQNLINNLKKINLHSINLDEKLDKTIIEEIFPYNKYSEEEFPNLKYFYLNDIPNQEHFINSFNIKENNKNKYPLINSIINDKSIREKIKLMKYIPKINQICNYMINYVNNKFSRDEAKKIKVKDEIKDEKFILSLKNFIPIYKEIRPHIEQVDCHQLERNEYQEIDEDNVLLSDLCVDSGEMGFGFVLLGIYKEFAEWQNTFISEIINSDNIQLNNYKELFNTKIKIQDCEEEQILDLPTLDGKLEPKDEKSPTLFEFILGFSNRKNGKIIYNYDEIEDELAALILPKLKCFKQEFRKVIYQFECFIGERSSLIVQLLDKYKQRKLTEIEINAIISCITKNQNNNKNNMKNLLVLLQVLIDIIVDECPKDKECILSIIERKENMPYKEFGKKFFNKVKENIQKFEILDEKKEKKNDDEYLTIECLINLLEIVELFCWENISKNLNDKYKEDIDNKIKAQFDLIFNVKKENKNIFEITKAQLCSAIRKFLSRYLSGKNKNTIINPNNLLKSYLIKYELWPLNLEYNEIENWINSNFGDLEIHISQSLKLYEYLGGDKEILEGYNDKYAKFEEKYQNKISKNIKKEKKDDSDKNKASNEMILSENANQIKPENSGASEISEMSEISEKSEINISKEVNEEENGEEEEEESEEIKFE